MNEWMMAAVRQSRVQDSEVLDRCKANNVEKAHNDVPQCRTPSALALETYIKTSTGNAIQHKWAILGQICSLSKWSNIWISGLRSLGKKKKKKKEKKREKKNRNKETDFQPLAWTVVSMSCAYQGGRQRTALWSEPLYGKTQPDDRLHASACW